MNSYLSVRIHPLAFDGFEITTEIPAIIDMANTYVRALSHKHLSVLVTHIRVGWFAPIPAFVRLRIPEHHTAHVRVRCLQLPHDAEGLRSVGVRSRATAVGDAHPKNDFRTVALVKGGGGMV